MNGTGNSLRGKDACSLVDNLWTRLPAKAGATGALVAGPPSYHDGGQVLRSPRTEPCVVPGCPVRKDVGGCGLCRCQARITRHPGLLERHRDDAGVSKLQQGRFRLCCWLIDRRLVPSVVSYRRWPLGGRFFTCFSSYPGACVAPAWPIVEGWFLTTRVAILQFRAGYGIHRCWL